MIDISIVKDLLNCRNLISQAPKETFEEASRIIVIIQYYALFILFSQIYSARDLEESINKIREILSDDKHDWEQRVAAVGIHFIHCLVMQYKSNRGVCVWGVCFPQGKLSTIELQAAQCAATPTL